MAYNEEHFGARVLAAKKQALVDRDNLQRGLMSFGSASSDASEDVYKNTLALLDYHRAKLRSIRFNFTETTITREMDHRTLFALEKLDPNEQLSKGNAGVRYAYQHFKNNIEGQVFSKQQQEKMARHGYTSKFDLICVNGKSATELYGEKYANVADATERDMLIGAEITSAMINKGARVDVMTITTDDGGKESLTPPMTVQPTALPRAKAPWFPQRWFPSIFKTKEQQVEDKVERARVKNQNDPEINANLKASIASAQRKAKDVLRQAEDVRRQAEAVQQQARNVIAQARIDKEKIRVAPYVRALDAAEAQDAAEKRKVNEAIAADRATLSPWWQSEAEYAHYRGHHQALMTDDPATNQSVMAMFRAQKYGAPHDQEQALGWMQAVVAQINEFDVSTIDLSDPSNPDVVNKYPELFALHEKAHAVYGLLNNNDPMKKPILDAEHQNRLFPTPESKAEFLTKGDFIFSSTQYLGTWLKEQKHTGLLKFHGKEGLEKDRMGTVLSQMGLSVSSADRLKNQLKGKTNYNDYRLEKELKKEFENELENERKYEQEYEQEYQQKYEQEYQQEKELEKELENELKNELENEQKYEQEYEQKYQQEYELEKELEKELKNELENEQKYEQEYELENEPEDVAQDIEKMGFWKRLELGLYELEDELEDEPEDELENELEDELVDVDQRSEEMNIQQVVDDGNTPAVNDTRLPKPDKDAHEASRGRMSPG